MKTLYVLYWILRRIQECIAATLPRLVAKSPSPAFDLLIDRLLWES